MNSLPYIPKGRTIHFVEHEHPFMKKAEEVAKKYSKDSQHKTGAVIVKNEKILGFGANGSLFHKQIGCPRKWLGVKTGTFYALCPGCSPKNHAEQTAIRNAKISGKNISGADLYLYGHWWCCHSCWEKMIESNIKNVYLLKDAQKHFQKK